MSCRITRNNEGSIEQVNDKYGRPSTLYEEINQSIHDGAFEDVALAAYLQATHVSDKIELESEPTINSTIVTKILDNVHADMNSWGELGHQVKLKETSDTLENSLDYFLMKIGVEVREVDVLKDESGNPVSAMGLADMTNRVIQLSTQGADISTLSEEAAHFLVEILRSDENPLYNSMYKMVESFEIFKEMAKPDSFYYKQYDGNMDMIKREAIGKIISEHIVKGKDNLESKEKLSRLERWWNRVLNALSGIFGKTVSDPFIKSAMHMFNNDLESAVNIDPRTAQLTGVFYQDKTVAETLEMIKDFEGRYEIDKVELADVTSKDLKKYFVQLAGDESSLDRYVGKKGSIYEGIELKIRASDAASIIYNKKTSKRYLSDEEKIFQDVNAKVRMSVGTKGHLIMEKLVDVVFHKKGSIGKILTSVGTTFSEAHVKKLHKSMLHLKSVIDAQQKVVDPKGKYTILPEQFISDEAVGMGGTIDLLVLFSDNSASIYDYKFKGTAFKNSTWSKHSKKLEVTKDMFADSIEGYDSQIGVYRDALLSKYGVTSIRQSRIIPIGIKYKTNKKKELSEVVEGLDVWTGDEKNDSHSLEHLPVALELTGDENIDKLSMAEMRRYRKLADELSHTKAKDKEAVEKRMEASQRIIKTLRLHQDVAPALAEANRLVKRANLGMGVEDEFITVKGEEEFNPKYLSEKELLTIYKELVHFRGFTELERVRETLAKSPKSKALLESLNSSTGNIVTTIKSLQDAIVNRMDTKARAMGIKSFKYNRQMSALNSYVNISSHSSAYSRYMHETMVVINGKALEFEKALAGEIKAAMDALESGSMTIQEGYAKLINPLTHNLYAKFSHEFYKDKKAAISEGNHAWMKANYQVDEEYYQKEFSNWKKSTFNMIDKEYPNAPEAAASAKKSWLEKYDVKNSDKAWVGPGGTYFTKINEEATRGYITPEYSEIANTPELKQFYDFHVKKVHEFEKRFGKNLGHTFIGNVHKSLVDSVIEDGNPFSTLSKSAINVFKTREHELEFAKADTDGSGIRHVPRLYTAELMSEDAEGNEVIDRSLRSNELGRSLYLLGQAAIQYELKHEVQDEMLLIEAILKDNMIDSVLEDDRGNTISQGHQRVKTVFNAGQANAESFTDLVDKAIYGISLKTKDSVTESGISFNKSMLALKAFHSVAALGLKMPVALGALGAGIVGVNIQGKKGIHITTTNVREAELALIARDPKVRAIMEHFQLAVLDESKRRGEMLASTVRAKYLTGDRWFEFLAQADKVVDTVLAVAMSKNHGVDANGNLKRMNELPKGTLSMYDSMELTENKDAVFGVTDRYAVKIPGMEANAFNNFRARMATMSTKVKGSASPESINTAGMTIINRFFLHYRSWLPGLALERFGMLRYDHTLEHFDQGTMRGFFGNFGPDEMFDSLGQAITAEWALHEYAGAILVDAGKIALDIGTFGLTNAHKIKEGKARREFKNFMVDQTMNEEFAFKTKEEEEASFQKFLELKRGNLKGSIAELRAVALLMLTLMAMGGDWDDDGKIDINQSWLGRKIHNVFGRVYRETAVFWDLTELTGPRSTGIPLLGLAQDGIKLINNSMDEFWDRVTGKQGVETDRAEAWFYAWKFAPGLGGFVKTLEIYPQHKNHR